MPRKSTRPATGKTVRLDIPIPAELATRLYGISALAGIRKSALVVRLLDQGLRRYRADREMGEISGEGQGIAGGG
jgi:hypothetical protein